LKKTIYAFSSQVVVRPGLCPGSGIELEEEDMVVVEAAGGRSSKFLDYAEWFSLKIPRFPELSVLLWAAARSEWRVDSRKKQPEQLKSSSRKEQLQTGKKKGSAEFRWAALSVARRAPPGA
jgi:hypothetical protein